MRSPWLLVALSLVVGVGASCSDDAETPAVTGSRDEFCAELRTTVEAHLTIFDPLAPASTEDTQAATARLADAAPEAVATEMALLADTFAEVVAVLDEVDPSSPEAVERLEALGIDQDEVAAAQTAVTSYAADECRIDLAAINAASVTTTSTSVAPPAPTTTGVTETTVAPSSAVTTTVPPVTG